MKRFTRIFAGAMIAALAVVGAPLASAAVSAPTATVAGDDSFTAW
ncbi:hypothetical protein [Streptomyces sp. JJ66]|nr:hypothetical protein [Streptomyces sp. JJ66]